MGDDDLDDLQWHWSGAYAICHPGPDRWVAQRLDNRETLRAESAHELQEVIRQDYALMPVPRGIKFAGL